MNNISFYIPQRQSLSGMIFLFLYTVGKIIKIFVPIILIFVLKQQYHKNWLFWVGLGIALILMLVWSYLSYRKFVFYINEESQEFVLEKGVVNVEKTIIEKKKIQEVIINQSFLHKILGIYQVEIDSPGTNDKNLKINAVTKTIADSLKQNLMSDSIINNAIIDEVEKNDKTENKIDISPISLAKSAFTSDYFYSFFALLGIIFYLRDQAKNITGVDLNDYILDENNQEKIFNLSIFILIGGALLFFGIAILINVLRRIIKYYGMKLVFRDSKLEISYGLLNSKQNVINRQKLQMLIISQNYLQKRLGIFNLKMTQIGENEFDKNKSSVIPGCSNEELNQIESFLFPKLENFEISLKPHLRKLILGILLWSVLPSIFIGFILYFYNISMLFVFFYIIFVTILKVANFKNSKLLLQHDFVQENSGTWEVIKGLWKLKIYKL